MLNQKGQTLVILLLIMVVALAVGLSVATRSITDLRISTRTEQSSRAFSAAEAGIEEALRDLSKTAGTQEITPGVKYTYTVEQKGATSYAPSDSIKKDDTIEVKLTGSTATSFNLYWAIKNVEDCTNDPASAVVAIVSGTAPYSISRSAYGLKPRGDGFTVVNPADNTFGDKIYCGKVENIPIPANSQIARIKMYYNSTSIAIQPNSGTLPPQTYTIRSEGEVGGVKRTIEVTRSLPSLPAIFDYVLFSGTSIAK